MRKSLLVAFGLAALVALPAVAYADNGSPWIHVRVEEVEKQTSVKVNLPLSVVEVALEAAPELIESHGDLHLGENEKMKIETARKIWAELAAVGDTEIVTVESEEENVRVFRKGDLIHVLVDNKGEKGTQVQVEVPVSLVDALLSSTEGDQINLKAALTELQKKRGNIVTVTEPDTTVRIWIDEQNAQD